MLKTSGWFVFEKTEIIGLKWRQLLLMKEKKKNLHCDSIEHTILQKSPFNIR